MHVKHNGGGVRIG